MGTYVPHSEEIDSEDSGTREDALGEKWGKVTLTICAILDGHLIFV